jgi:hypothetical protein
VQPSLSLTESSSAQRAVRIRHLRSDDGELLNRVFAGMSPQSRYQRFHAPKPCLTPADHAVLTSVDRRHHIALVALAPDGAPLAVMRAVRLQDDPAAAELAGEVVDAWQRRGLGTQLTVQLARLAVAAGIQRLVARVHDESGLVRPLWRRGWRTVERDGAAVLLEADAWTIARTVAPGLQHDHTGAAVA